MKTRRNAVVKDRNVYVYCLEAICGTYYYPVATMYEREQAIDLVKGAQDERIIIRFGERRWVVTSKESDADDIKSIRCECRNLIDAQEMMQ